MVFFAFLRNFSHFFRRGVSLAFAVPRVARGERSLSPGFVPFFRGGAERAHERERKSVSGMLPTGAPGETAREVRIHD